VTLTAADATAGFLDWMLRERQASPLTAEAYGTSLRRFSAFLAGHLGHDPTLADLAVLTQADFRAWLAQEAGTGSVNATRARHLSAVRSLYRYLARHHGIANPAPGLLGTHAPARPSRAPCPPRKPWPSPPTSVRHRWGKPAPPARCRRATPRCSPCCMAAACASARP